MAQSHNNMNGILRFFIVISLFLCHVSLNSCKSENKMLIPKDAFVALITDIHLAEGYYKTQKLPANFKNDTALYAYIYENHGFSKAQVDSTLSYYVNTNPREYIRLYNEVIANINRVEAEFKSEK